MPKIAEKPSFQMRTIVTVCKNLRWGMPYGSGPKAVLESKFLNFWWFRSGLFSANYSV
jgi:hypothetical protein